MGLMGYILCKSTDWFLYDRNFPRERNKVILEVFHQKKILREFTKTSIKTPASVYFFQILFLTKSLFLESLFLNLQQIALEYESA